MADSIRELIIKNVQTTLTGITAVAGYTNTVLSVQRFRQLGQLQADLPMILIREGAETSKDGPAGGSFKITNHLTLDLLLIGNHDPATDSRASDEVMNSLVADVKKAMLADRTRGGHAIDTTLTGCDALDAEEGQPDLAQVVSWEVHYRHSALDPAVA